MAAESQESMEGWMKALSCASYDFMKLMVAELQKQLDDIDGTIINFLVKKLIKILNLLKRLYSNIQDHASVKFFVALRLNLNS